MLRRLGPIVLVWFAGACSSDPALGIDASVARDAPAIDAPAIDARAIDAPMIDTGSDVGQDPGDAFAVTDAPDAATATTDAGGGATEIVLVSTYLGGVFAFTAQGGVLSSAMTAPLDHGAHFYGIAAHPSGQFAYAFDYEGGDIVSYRVAPSGMLTHLAGSPLHVGHGPTTAVVDPSGRFLYVGFSDVAEIEVLPIGANGELDASAARHVASTSSLGYLAVDPIGHFLHASGAGLEVFALDATGAPSSIGAPFAPAAVLSGCVVADPSGAHVYNAHLTLQGFAVGPTGALSSIPPTPISTDVASDDFATSLAVDPSGASLYAINAGNDHLGAWTIEANGQLTPVAGAAATTSLPYSIAVSRDGRFVYVGRDDGNVAVFSRGANGALSSVGAPVPVNGLQLQVVVTAIPPS